ncbi:hypothetical protein K350107B32_10690 [Agathobaculum butyriciproducens]
MRWIPVNEELPELKPMGDGVAYSETVLALTDGVKVMAAILKEFPDGEKNWVAPFEFWDAEDESITHWAEIPTLPEVQG